ncbi:MAG: hypothetical protein AAF636_18105 [Pseudomonadota bacterium]
MVSFLALGTAIPAAAITHHAGLLRVLRRARYTFLQTAANLLVGPGLICGLVLGVTITAEAFGFYISIPGELAGVSFVTIAEHLVFGFLTTGLAVSATAAILSDAYLIGEKRLSGLETQGTG